MKGITFIDPGVNEYNIETLITIRDTSCRIQYVSFLNNQKNQGGLSDQDLQDSLYRILEKIKLRYSSNIRAMEGEKGVLKSISIMGVSSSIGINDEKMSLKKKEDDIYRAQMMLGSVVSYFSKNTLPSIEEVCFVSKADTFVDTFPRSFLIEFD